MHRDALKDFFRAPAAIPLPSAARPLYWLGRLRQWRGIDLNVNEDTTEPDWNALRKGVLEALAGTYALAIYEDVWRGPRRRQIYDRDMALLIAMLVTLGWPDLAAHVLECWFGGNVDHAGRPVPGGITGMIVSVAGKGLNVPVVPCTFQKGEELLVEVIDSWNTPDSVFAPLAEQLADRHLSHCRLDSGQMLFDFDHPVEQAMPIELLMLFRLRGETSIPDVLLDHAALRHPAATLVEPQPPVLSSRCRTFLDCVSSVLPDCQTLDAAIRTQASRFTAR
ncbi:hypothetical protein [Paraburkholderia saeva]|uniref:Uncharacterized protein n=1 Tax=Paraburkholderia saeva TaxID=2777537 RepID=A0A9N8X2Z5_9BURK|nr:hypothetical protein [Paraburkholderia saeva]CAG4903766.1 hypothetical protein R70241_03130 [Paraburkholderia saeva]CAG4905609.1 hypothetical protein R52603_03333 [Paraburkholderia saeva]CAG4909526.1 hypothetical protein LMG31841_03876 [Paraburkholderia saeva]